MPLVDNVSRADIGLYACASHAEKGLGARMVWDVSCLRDPAARPEYRNAPSDMPELQRWMLEDPRVVAIRDECLIFADVWSGTGTNKTAFFSIKFHDKSGKFISPVVRAIVAKALSDRSYNVFIAG